MALTERVEVGQITYNTDGTIYVRTDTVIEKDGEELHRSYHRHVVEPEADTTNEDELVKIIAERKWTPELIQKWRDKRARDPSPNSSPASSQKAG